MTEASTNPRKTPLYDLHVELGGKMVDFAGWMMPVNYTAGVAAEHKQCRSNAALFDVSHMGQVELHGNDIAAKLETLCPSSFGKLPVGKARYTFFTNPQGGIMDDLIVANAGDYFVAVVNASMREQDVAHLQSLDLDIHEIDRSLIAIQGPAAETIVASIAPAAADLKFMETGLFDLLGSECRIARLGYTGEDGYEISLPNDRAVEITRKFLEHPDLAPAGLGARDSLRLEAGLCLYGNDIDNDTSPVEANLVWAMQKARRENGGFPGEERILNELANGPSRRLVGIKPEGRAPARRGVEVADTDGNIIGAITSGGFGPTYGGPVSMGYVASEHSAEGTAVNLLIRGKSMPATIIKLPFVAQNYKR
ncbi:MAG: glycine cleavage system aminomethyltransferase GcvT [Rhodobacteraceae bacterium]|nr:glycine cleavage system aminomethyltransferase GcvT [Paracoccaceae bacterium]